MVKYSELLDGHHPSASIVLFTLACVRAAGTKHFRMHKVSVQMKDMVE